MSLDDVKKKVTETAKNAADNAKQAASKIDMDKVKASAEKAKENLTAENIKSAAEKAKENLTADNIKAAAEKAKENLSAENLKASAEKFKAFDNKKKGMIIGGGVAALGLLFWLFSGSSNILGETFPSNDSLKAQCEFTVDYENAAMTAMLDGMSQDKLEALMTQDMKNTDGMKRGVARSFYRDKEDLHESLGHMYRMLEEMDAKERAWTQEKAQSQIGDRDEDVKRCIKRYSNR
ncbi:hypothetical protein VST7929_02192 [Vibrio stylophorae]|uniref:Uncharacterized protein n=1 Tax=Vibrio stylophorae TaxID=659351 RepID=A0ABM8ZVC1_9VIBR|nr:hypothetical protein [Vibrio stylophorae]CAH0534276.1 hypothetical protein VST7929_02192 [Vibrio stylophorae]